MDKAVLETYVLGFWCIFARYLCGRQQLRQVGGAHKDRYGSLPDLIVVILPENGNDIYNAVKQYV